MPAAGPSRTFLYSTVVVPYRTVRYGTVAGTVKGATYQSEVATGKPKLLRWRSLNSVFERRYDISLYYLFYKNLHLSFASLLWLLPSVQLQAVPCVCREGRALTEEIRSSY